MTIASFIILQLVVALGAFVQSVTGFGIGVIIMAGIASFHIFPLEKAVMFTIFLALINVIVSLKGQGLRRDDFTINRFVLAAAPTCILGGYVLFLSVDYPVAYNSLYGVLGTLIIATAVSLLVNQTTRTTDSPRWAFYGVSALSGFLGGLFSVPGPSMLYFLYRQPWQIDRLRRVMMLLFATVIVSRLIFAISINFDFTFMIWTLLSCPAVYLASLLGRTYRHKFNVTLIKRITIVVLVICGGNIIMQATGRILTLTGG